VGLSMYPPVVPRHGSVNTFPRQRELLEALFCKSLSKESR
jgi:hypothetical protein